MYFSPTGEIWAIAPGGAQGGRYWYVVNPTAAAPAPDAVPPEGLRLPTLGFGAVWAGVPGVGDALGFARTDETAAALLVQAFEGGALLFDRSAGQVFALVGGQGSGTVYGPY
jgi:hypothetical protein